MSVWHHGAIRTKCPLTTFKQVTAPLLPFPAIRATLISQEGTVLTVQLPQPRECPACGRTIYGRGLARVIEAARTAKGNDLVDEYLAKKPWLLLRNRPQVSEADVAIVFDEYARKGHLRIPKELNDLDLSIGLREIKVGPARFPFYELVDQLHPVIATRLTHGFTKGTDKTPFKEIAKAKAVMEYDRSQP